MAKIYLVRHGESLANKQGIYQGQSYDTDLSLLGKKQAIALGKKFANIKLAKIIASPLKRTKQTAEPVAKNLGLKISIDSAIIETNHGKWEGMKKIDIQVTWPVIYAKWFNNPGQTKFPDGEKFEETITRVTKWWKSQKFDTDTLVVTHDNIIRIILTNILKKSMDKIWRFELESGGITIVENKSLRYKVLAINNIDHLRGIRANIAKQAL